MLVMIIHLIPIVLLYFECRLRIWMCILSDIVHDIYIDINKKVFKTFHGYVITYFLFCLLMLVIKNSTVECGMFLIQLL